MQVDYYDKNGTFKEIVECDDPKVICFRHKEKLSFYYLVEAGPHIKAVCHECGMYIKFVDRNLIINKQKSSNMAADKIIHGRINLDAFNPKWVFQGEKGRYLDFAIFYNEEQDEYKNNGMIVQSVPNDVFRKEKDLQKDQRSKGAILGNVKEFDKVGNREESSPGYTGSKSTKEKVFEKEEKVSQKPEEEDDLPF